MTKDQRYVDLNRTKIPRTRTIIPINRTNSFNNSPPTSYQWQAAVRVKRKNHNQSKNAKHFQMKAMKTRISLFANHDTKTELQISTLSSHILKTRNNQNHSYTQARLIIFHQSSVFTTYITIERNSVESASTNNYLGRKIKAMLPTWTGIFKKLIMPPISPAMFYPVISHTNDQRSYFILLSKTSQDALCSRMDRLIPRQY